MPEIERYTPSQMETEIQDLAVRYVSAVGEVEEDNGIFDDINTCIDDAYEESPPRPILIPKTFTENGTYVATEDNADGYSQVTVALAEPVEEKYVTFYDYEGTPLYSYTRDEIAVLSELPPLPTNDRLLAQEWNWSLEDIKANGTSLMVGAVYTTKDGSTQMDYEFLEDDGAVEAGIAVNIISTTVVTVDWGDGAVENITLSAHGNITHTYQSTHKKGTLKISFDKQVNHLQITNNWFTRRVTALYLGNNILRAGTYDYNSLVYAKIITIPNTITKMESLCCGSKYVKAIVLPANITAGDANIKNTYSLEKLITPKSVTSLKVADTRQMVSRCNVSNLLTTIPSYSFQNLPLLETLDIPYGVTTIGGGLFYQGTGILSIYIPKSVTSIGDNIVFQTNVQRIDLSAYDDPATIPTITTATFAQSGSFLKAYFRNQTMLDAFASATNWSAYADSFVIGGRYADGGDA